MKKQEIKRAVKRSMRARKMDMARKRKLILTLFLVMFGLFAGTAMAAAAFDITLLPDALKMSGGTVLAGGMALIGNIEDSSDRDSAGGQIAYQVWLISLDQIDQTLPWPQPNANREVGAIPLKAGEVMHYFEAHDIPTDDSKGEKGDFTTATTNTFVIQMSGNRDKLLDFVENYAGTKFVIIYRECESDNYYIMGSFWKPMVLKSFERANNKEKRGITFTFENSTWRQPAKYVGPIVRSEPVQLTAGTDTLAIVANNDQYILPNGADAAVPVTKISGLTANDKGRTITITGTGSDKAATIEAGAAFVLEGGATWTAKAGSSITLRVLDPTRLVEVSGTRVQSA